MKRAIALLIVLAVAAGAGSGVYYYYHRGGSIPGITDGPGTSAAGADAIPVDSVALLAGLSQNSSSLQRYAGVVEPQKTSEIKLENESKVKEWYVEVNDLVKTGDKLFTYDVTEDEAKLAQAEIDLERYENDIEANEITIQQYEKDKAKASASDQLEWTNRILTEQNTKRTNEYNYKSKQLEIEQLKDKIDNSTVSSDMDGIIKSINDPESDDSGFYSFGSSGSDQAAITIMQVGEYRIKGTANELNIDQIYEGMDVLVHSRVDANAVWQGVISDINRDLSSINDSSSSSYYGESSDSSGSSSNYPFYVELQGSEGLILGQHVYIEEDLGQGGTRDGIWLDEYYFSQEEGKWYVWAASSKNTLEKREVTLGNYDDLLLQYEVVSGLSADDYITIPTEDVAEGLAVVKNESTSSYVGDLSGDDFDFVEGGGWMDDGDDGLGIEGYYEEDDGGFFDADNDSGFGGIDGAIEVDEDFSSLIG